MAEIIKCNTTTLKNDSDDVIKNIKSIESRIVSLKSEVKALNSMWEGSANKAFNKAFNDDIASLNDMCESLRGFYKYETNAVSEYDKCEKAIANAINEINI